MKKIQKLILLTTLLYGTIFFTQNLSAAEQTTSAQSINTTEETTSAQTPLKQATSEQATTEFPTKEPPTESPSVTEQSDFIVSNLSPVQSKVIVLDPGHCSKHTGARGNGLKEERVVLDIAKACQNELNQYGNVTVYMTRENNKCCKSLNLGDCLTARNNYAKKLNADFLISLHINWDKKASKKGANVLAAYKSRYNDDIRIQTQALGKIILSNLSSIGVKNKGLLLRKFKNSRYRNGSLADYYSIVRNGVLNQIPSIIIEHGYISNSSDCSKYFSTKSKRKSLGITDANAIISYYGLNKNLIEGKFVKKGSSSYYMTKDNKKVTGWVKDQGKWYYFNNNGKMKTGFLTLNKNTFYLNPSTGEMTVGWLKVKGKNYLSKGNGTLVKNQLYSDGISTYLFSSSGIRKTGWVKYKGKKYYFNKKQGNW